MKKDLDVEISNMKEALGDVYKLMNQQEQIMREFEKRYGDVLKEHQKNTAEKKESTDTKKEGGVLV